MSNLDVGPLAADSVSRGYIRPSWYLIDIEAGFELWRGGAGLATDSFSVNVNGHQASQAPVAPSNPVTPARAAGPSPAPSPSTASPLGISLQAISPEPTTPEAATNATLAFKNAGSATASNETLVVEVRDSAGTIVGSQSWTGQNVAPQETLSETYTWTASSRAGKYTVEGLCGSSRERPSARRTWEPSP